MASYKSVIRQSRHGASSMPWPRQICDTEWGSVIELSMNTPGFGGGVSTLGQPALTISNPIESGCITNSARTHAGTPAGLNICGGWGLAPSVMRTTTMLAAWAFIAPESVRGWY